MNKHLKTIAILIGILIYPIATHAQDVDDNPDSWTRYIRGFRRSHHFSIVSGAMHNTWDLSNISSSAQSEESYAGLVKFRYSFHLPWVRKTGFLLGTSFGIRMEPEQNKLNYKSSLGYQYPGLLAGLVYNFNSATRVWTSYERFLERIDPIEIDTPSSKTKFGTTLTVNDVGVGFDYFYSLRWALSLELHYSFSESNNPKKSDAPNNPLTDYFNRRTYWAGLGVIFHHL